MIMPVTIHELCSIIEHLELLFYFLLKMHSIIFIGREYLWRIHISSQRAFVIILKSGELKKYHSKFT